MAERKTEDIRGIVQEFRHHDTFGDSFKMNDCWYNYSKDGPQAGATRCKAGDQVQVTFVLWQKPGTTSAADTKRYVQQVRLLDTMEDGGDPPWEPEEEAMLLEPRSAPAQTTNTQLSPPTNGRAPASVAQPPSQTQRSLESVPGVYTMSPGLLVRIEAAKIAATYLAHKEGIDSDEDLLRCAEKVEGWIFEDRPHFVTED